MSAENDRRLSVEQLGVAVSNLVELATGQQDVCEQQQDVCKQLLGELRMTLNDLKRMPNKIAQQAAQDVVQRITGSVKGSVTDVLRPAQAELRTLGNTIETLRKTIEEAAANYRFAAWIAISLAYLSGLVTAILPMMVWRFWL